MIVKRLQFCKHAMTPKHPFSALLERRFLEWQLEIGERKSQADFAKVIGVSRASLTMWMNGNHFPERENVNKLAKVLGMEVYDTLGIPRPNAYLQKIIERFERIPPDKQQKLAEDAERYELNNDAETKHIKATPERRKKTPPG